MAFPSGSRLGPYEVVSPLGAGGMGEVYRARDPRLGREVAIKVLPSELASDAGRLKRFEKEARSASALNHPNIVTIYEIGSADSISYIAMELVEGKTLRELLFSGALGIRKLLPLASQIADGLARAHEAGIVHRDLKPENVMVTRDRLVKILDFGLAKLTGPATGSDEGSHLPTETGTSPGMLVGTAGYMSPEQAGGQPVDFRSDQFAFGSILYEMTTGKRAFHKKTGVDTLAAVLNEEPEPIHQVNAQVPLPLRWITERCLSKDPDGRYASTKDLAAELRTVRDHMSETTVLSSAVVWPRRGLGAAIAAAVVLVLGGLAVALFLAKRVMDRPPPSFQQLTFRRGAVFSARFAGGDNIVYTAAWDGKPMEIFTSSLQSPEARSLGLSGTELLAVSASGEMAVSLNRSLDSMRRWGTLARLSIGGGVAPREVLEGVWWADWSPDGQNLAIVREHGFKLRLEYPVGKVLHETTPPGWVSHPRVSRDGERVAYVDHPTLDDDAGVVVVADRSGKKTRLTSSFTSLQGLAWSPREELWFTATSAAESAGGTYNRVLYSVTPGGEVRRRATIAGCLTLHDISSDGRMLVSRDSGRSENVVRAPGESEERDLSWFDWSVPADLSSDGKLFLFTGPCATPKSREGAAEGCVYLRKTDGSPPVRLGDGRAGALSPDGKWALAILDLTTEPRVVAYPTGPGEPKVFPRDGLTGAVLGTWLPDGKSFIFIAKEPGHGDRVFLRDFNGEKPRAVTPEGVVGWQLTPDGKWIFARGADRNPHFYPIDGGEPREIGHLAKQRLIRFGADPRSAYVGGPADKIPLSIYRLDLPTGRRELLWALKPAELAGVLAISSPKMTPDGGSYVYHFQRMLSDLYLLEAAP